MAVPILVNTIIAAVGRISTIAIGIVVAAVLTRYLGAEGFGIYIFILSFGTILQTGADFGLYLTLSREIADKKAIPQQVFTHIASLRFVLLAATFLVGVLILPSLSPYPHLLGPCIILLLGLALQSYSQLLMAVYQAYGVVWRATIGDIAGRLVQIAGLLIIFFSANIQSYIPSPLFAAVAVFTIGSALATIVHVSFLPNIHPWKLVGSHQEWKRFIKISWPLAVVLISNAIYFRIDAVMLSYLRPGVEVGWYGLAYRIVESTLFFPAMFGGLLLPHISASLSARNINKARGFVEQGLILIMTGGGFVAVVLSIYASEIIQFLSGPAFLPAARLLQILTIALFIMFVGNFFGYILVSLNKQKELLYLSLALVVGNIVANAIFIPLFGATAAAITTVCTEICAMSIGGFLVYTSLPFSFPYIQISKLILILAAMYAVSLLLPDSWHVIWKCFGLSIIFLTGIIVLRLLQQKDISLLMARHSV